MDQPINRITILLGVAFLLNGFGLAAWAIVEDEQNLASEPERLLKSGDFVKASELCRTLLGQDTDGSVHAALMVALAKQGQIIEAEQLLRGAKIKFSDQPKVLAAAALTCYLHSGSASGPAKRELYLEAAKNLARRSAQVSPKNLLAHQVLALSRQALHERADAISEFRKCLEIEKSPENLTNLAQALSEENSLDAEVQVLISRALALDSRYYPARVQQAIVRLSKNQIEEALKELLMVPTNARDALWSVTEGRVLIKQGHESMAISSWNLARKLDRYLLEPYKQFALYYCSKNRIDLVINELNKARGHFLNSDDELGESLRTYFDEKLPGDLFFRMNIQIDKTKPSDERKLPEDISFFY